MMKIGNYILISFIALLVLAGCQQMEYNYEEYLGNEVIYSPSVRNLKDSSILKEIFLTWDNPPSNIATQIIVDYQDSVITADSMIDSIHLVDLEVKGYTISVYTMDAFGNLSLPAVITSFPDGEND